jgi:hypothetical protein
MNRLLSNKYTQSIVREFGREMSVQEAKTWDERYFSIAVPGFECVVVASFRPLLALKRSSEYNLTSGLFLC